MTTPGEYWVTVDNSLALGSGAGFTLPRFRQGGCCSPSTRTTSVMLFTPCGVSSSLGLLRL
jgi:hypothetical protein